MFLQVGHLTSILLQHLPMCLEHCVFNIKSCKNTSSKICSLILCFDTFWRNLSNYIKPLWQEANCAEYAHKQSNVKGWQCESPTEYEGSHSSPFPPNNLNLSETKPPELHRHRQMHIIILCAIELVENDKFQMDTRGHPVIWSNDPSLSHMHTKTPGPSVTHS